MLVYIVPILFVSVGWFNYEPVSLVASILLSLVVFTYFLFQKKFEFRKSLLYVAPVLLPIIYLTSGIINSQSIESLLFGGYGRNLGLLTFLSLTLIFILTSSQKIDVKKYIDTGFMLTLSLANIYGYIQFFDVDPIPWQNPYNAISLTLGNPNFAGALFGCLSVIAFSKALSSPSIFFKLIQLILFISSLFLSFQTNSLQSILLIILGVLVLIFVKSFKSQSLKGKIINRLTVLGVLTSISFVVSIFMFNFPRSFRERIFTEGSIGPRLDYWRTGIEIWKDNLFLGVGPDQFQRFAALYRNSNQVVRDGDFIIPDKAHNVFIDHFANGGIVAGILWIVFVLSIFHVIYRLMKIPNGNKDNLAVLVAIWTCYVAQSLISPDQLILVVIGFLTAGLLVNRFFNEVKKDQSNLALTSMKNNLIKALTAVFLVFTFYYSVDALNADIKAKNVLDGKIVGTENLIEVINLWPNPKFTEELAIESLSSPSNCDFSIKVADRLLSIDDRSSQGWFIKAFCANAKKDFNSAVRYVNKSLEFDPLNPYYLASKVKLEIAAGEIQKASGSLNRLKALFPKDDEIITLQSSIDALLLNN